MLNTATGVSGLPTDKGILALLLAIYKELFGYTADGTTVAGLRNITTSLTNNLNNTNNLLNNTTGVVNQHSSSINNLNQAVNTNAQDIQNLANNTATSRIPVGGILMTSYAANPNSYLGYGTWVQVCQGRHVAGVGNDIANGGHNFAQGKTGFRSFTIAVEQMPNHRHLSNALVRSQQLDNVEYYQSYSGNPTATWEHHKDYGAGEQHIPFTERQGSVLLFNIT